MPATGDSDRKGLVALARLAAVDHDEKIRELARNALVVRGDDSALQLLTTALHNNDPLVCANAEEALAAFGGPRVYEVLLEHWQESFGPSGRSSVFIGNQRSYVAGYNISGGSYEPVVKTFMTGQCLDGKVLGGWGDAYYMTLLQVSPKNVQLPADPQAWERWLKGARTELAKDGEQRRAAATAYLNNFRF